MTNRNAVLDSLDMLHSSIRCAQHDILEGRWGEGVKQLEACLKELDLVTDMAAENLEGRGFDDDD